MRLPVCQLGTMHWLQVSKGLYLEEELTTFAYSHGLWIK